MLRLTALLLLAAASPSVIPSTRATALDGHAVELPRDLSPSATVLVLGFARAAAEPSTQWGKALASNLGTQTSIKVLQMPMLAEVPGFARPLVLHSMRKEVPAALQPHFIPLTQDEDAWKQLAGYDPHTPNAAYVVLVDKTGAVRWQTHDPITPDRLTQLTSAARQMAAPPR